VIADGYEVAEPELLEAKFLDRLGAGGLDVVVDELDSRPPNPEPMMCPGYPSPPGRPPILDRDPHLARSSGTSCSPDSEAFDLQPHALGFDLTLSSKESFSTTSLGNQTLSSEPACRPI
jgi:hypothetical protein